MKLKSVLILPALLGALLLSACGEKPETATDAGAPAEAVKEAAPATPAAEPVSAAPAATSAGGYTPSAEELIPGVTMTKEEVDKQFSEARANTPVATVPGEEPAAAAAPAPAPTTPAEAAPAAAQ